MERIEPDVCEKTGGCLLAIVVDYGQLWYGLTKLPKKSNWKITHILFPYCPGCGRKVNHDHYWSQLQDQDDPK